MKLRRFIITSGVLLTSLSVTRATTLGFGQLGGANTAVPANYGSNATLDGSGLVVSLGGATPNIGLVWDPNWDIHTSTFFIDLENQTVGGGDWDNEGGMPRIGQLDFGDHTIGFTVDPGFALVLNSFDFAHTSETAGTTSWSLTLTAVSSSTVVWSDTVTFENGQVFSLTPEFSGVNGEDYVLRFLRTSESYNSNGRHGIDNFSFSQIAVPEPSSAGLLGLAGMALLARRLRRK